MLVMLKPLQGIGWSRVWQSVNWCKVWLNHSRTLPEQWYIECMTEPLQRCWQVWWKCWAAETRQGNSRRAKQDRVIRRKAWYIDDRAIAKYKRVKQSIEYERVHIQQSRSILICMLNHLHNHHTETNTCKLYFNRNMSDLWYSSKPDHKTSYMY